MHLPIVQPEPQWPHQVGPVGSHVNSCLFMIIRLNVEPQEIKCADLYSSLDWFDLPLGKADGICQCLQNIYLCKINDHQW